MKLSELALQLKDFFAAVYALIKKVFKQETGWVEEGDE